MNARALASAVLLAAAACDKAAVDPPLPPPKFEVAPAPPGALGAKAAGTDAAPAPPEPEPNPWSGQEELPPGHPVPAPEDGGFPMASDAGAGGTPL